MYNLHLDGDNLCSMKSSHQLPSTVNVISNDSYTGENDLKYSHTCVRKSNDLF